MTLPSRPRPITPHRSHVDWPPQDIEPTRAEREELERRIAAAKAGPHKAKPKRAEPERLGALREAVVAYGPRFRRRWMP